MPSIQIAEPNRPAATGWRPLGLGFRPFFLGAGIAAAALMALWLILWRQTISPPASYGLVGWHSHEMLFGYTAAVMAGFLLTAVRNWTGHPTPVGTPLGLLAAIWLAGRLMPWVPGVPPALTALVDLSFLPLLAAALVRPLWAGTNRVNRLFVPLLLAMAGANAMIHSDALGWSSALAPRGIRVMIDLVLLLIIMVGGRVLPFFTEKAVPGARAMRREWVEKTGFLLLLLMVVAHAARADAMVTGILFIALAILQMVRLAGWHTAGIWRIPILWVLYSGYGWLIAGLLLNGLGELGVFPASAAVHAVTVGGVGVLTLGMMARVALGHTGRPIRSVTLVNTAFVSVNGAAAARVLGPWLVPSWYEVWITAAAWLWVAGFAVFVVIYAPILLRPRVDGRAD